MNLPQDFIENTRPLFSEKEFGLFTEALEREAKSSLRFNPLKPAGQEFPGTAVPWCGNGLTLAERFSFTLDPLFHAGAYYVQESSSMFLEPLLLHALDGRKEGLCVLDLCAAPGGKSTHLASLIGPDNLLVSNEVIRSRAKILCENTIKWGHGNTVVTNDDPAAFSGLEGLFDIVLTDVPCSGEGMFRKNGKARDEWSLRNVQLCAERQRRILSDVWDALKPGGFLVYSTCTFNRQENEEQVAWIERELGASALFPGNIPGNGRIVRSDKGFRFYPHKTDGEGLFMALLRKEDGPVPKPRKPKNRPASKTDPKTLPAPLRADGYDFTTVGETVCRTDSRHTETIACLQASLHLLYRGTEIGELIRGRLRPSHALALSAGLPEGLYPQVEVSLETARDFLRKNNIDASPFREGYNFVAFGGLPIGLVKKVGNRANNLYPKESRILNL